ncbi:uncharacterized protein METZ01_LOCUS313211, partial [marine metagenome]
VKKYLFAALGAVAAFGIFLSVTNEPMANGQVRVDQPAVDFTLTDTKGNQVSLSDYKGKYVVMEWINYDCPFVGKHYESGNMQALQKIYRNKGVV